MGLPPAVGEVVPCRPEIQYDDSYEYVRRLSAKKHGCDDHSKKLTKLRDDRTEYWTKNHRNQTTGRVGLAVAALLKHEADRGAHVCKAGKYCQNEKKTILMNIAL